MINIGEVDDGISLVVHLFSKLFIMIKALEIHNDAYLY